MPIRSMDYTGADLKMLIVTEWEGKWRQHAAEKEPQTVKWMEDYVRPGDIFYDVGANVGPYSLIAAHLGATVYAFEPEGSNYVRLLQNVELNEKTLLGKVIALPLALWDQHEILTMHMSDPSPGAASHTYEPNGRARVQQPVVPVQADDLNMWGIPLPNHIKIDVDGYENRVLIGARLALNSPQLRSVLVEGTQESIVWIQQHLRSAGLLPKPLPAEDREVKMYLFVRPS